MSVINLFKKLYDRSSSSFSFNRALKFEVPARGGAARRPLATICRADAGRAAAGGTRRKSIRVGRLNLRAPIGRRRAVLCPGCAVPLSSLAEALVFQVLASVSSVLAEQHDDGELSFAIRSEGNVP